MNLRQKILLAIALTLVGLGGILYGISYYLLRSNFFYYEKIEATRNLIDTTTVLAREKSRFSGDWLDWSRWDQMFVYAQNRNPKVIQSSLTNVQFQDNKINFIAILNQQGKIIFATNYNLKTQQRSPISAAAQVDLQNPKWKSSNPDQRLTGIVKFNNQPMLITDHPILKSNAQQPVAGSLIVGKIIDQTWLSNLSLPSDQKLEVKLIDDLNLSSEWQNARSQLLANLPTIPEPNFLFLPLFSRSIDRAGSQKTPIYIQPLNVNRLASYTILLDIEQKPTILLRLETPRLVYERVTNGLYLLLLMLSIGGFAFGGIVLFLIEHLLISRLRVLGKDVQKIGTQADLSRRLPLNGSDELTSLVGTINTMLEALAYRSEQQKQVELEKELLLTINQQISKAPDFEMALQVALSRLGEFAKWAYGEVWIISADGMVLVCDSPWFINPDLIDTVTGDHIREFRDFTEAVSLLPHEETIGEVWQTLKPGLNDHLEVLGNYSPLRQELALKCGFHSHICFPLLKSQHLNPAVPLNPDKLTNRELIAVFSFFSHVTHEDTQASLKLVNDITAELGIVLEQKQTEAELKALFAAMNDAIVAIDSQGYFIKIAPTDTNLLARKPEELLGKRIQDIFSKAKADEFMDYIWRSLNSKQTVNAEYSFTLGSKLTWFAASISPITEDSVIWVIRDISDRKAAEFALKDALEAAKVASRAKGEFLANMSHELRTPLNAILGFTQLMISEADLAPEQQERLQIVSRSGEHLLALINDVLEMAKIESGRSTVNLTDFDLYDLLDTLKGMLSLRAESKGLSLIVERSPEVPRYVCSDAVKLRQVLINILGNAIKFTKFGIVALTVNCDSLTGFLRLKFNISDTGFGIAPHEIDYIFDAFIQSESGRKSVEGTGLGLPISRNFVQMLGGDIQAQSKLGEGTTITFDILAQISQNFVAPTSALKEISHLRNQKVEILLAEDNLVNQKVAIQMLKRLGYQADTVGNGLKVLEAIAQKSYDLILMDVQMPEMDGLEATQRIRLIEQQQDTLPLIIIAMTANAMHEDRDRCLAAGMNDHLSKPVRVEELQACLERWLESPV